VTKSEKRTICLHFPPADKTAGKPSSLICTESRAGVGNLADFKELVVEEDSTTNIKSLSETISVF